MYNFDIFNISRRFNIDKKLNDFLIQNDVKFSNRHGISSEHIKTVLKFFDMDTTVKTFDGSYFNGGYGISTNEVKLITDKLKSNKSVTYLDLHGQAIGTIGAKLIADLLTYNTSIIKLNLYRNSISDFGMASILKSLKENHTLLKIYVVEQPYEEDGFIDDKSNDIHDLAGEIINRYITRNIKHYKDTAKYLIEQLVEQQYICKLFEEIKFLDYYQILNKESLSNEISIQLEEKKEKTSKKKNTLSSYDAEKILTETDHYINKNYFKLTLVSKNLKLSSKKGKKIKHYKAIKKLFDLEDVLAYIASFLSLKDVKQETKSAQQFTIKKLFNVKATVTYIANYLSLKDVKQKKLSKLIIDNTESNKESEIQEDLLGDNIE